MWSQIRSFDYSVRLLLVNQLTINIGFYMLMPYLAAHLSGGLGLAGWAVGLVLGMRNLSQQGLFLLGGALADRYGCKPVIIAGCLLRTAGFTLLGLAGNLPALLIAAAATGFAGALFNPAVRAHLAHGAADRRVEAFALFNVFYQAGILIGPLIGLALLAADFRLVCLVAAALFALLSVVQITALPRGGPTAQQRHGVVDGWRTVPANRPFLLFSAAMAASYVLSFQIYLALPLALNSTTATTLVFTVSAVVAIAGQLRVTAWARRRWDGPTAIVRGLTLMAGSFVPLVAYSLAQPTTGPANSAIRLIAVLACTIMLTMGTVLTYPFEMDTIVTLSADRLVATHYGLYNTIAGLGITVGNLGTGYLLDKAAHTGWHALPWLVLTIAGCGCALAVRALSRTGRLPAPDLAKA